MGCIITCSGSYMRISNRKSVGGNSDVSINSTSQNENSLLEKPWYNVGTALKEELVMAKHYDKQFKLDAVQYYHDHKNLGLQGCATNLGISQQTYHVGRKNCVKPVILKAAVTVTTLLMKEKKSYD